MKFSKSLKIEMLDFFPKMRKRNGFFSLTLKYGSVLKLDKPFTCGRYCSPKEHFIGDRLKCVYLYDRWERRYKTVQRVLFGDSPEEYLEYDHINRDPADNRKSNIRLVPDWINSRNKSTTPEPGIYKRKNGKYSVKIAFKKKDINLMSFGTYEKDLAAYVFEFASHLIRDEKLNPYFVQQLVFKSFK
jgi:hypothetical protein